MSHMSPSVGLKTRGVHLSGVSSDSLDLPFFGVDGHQPLLRRHVQGLLRWWQRPGSGGEFSDAPMCAAICLKQADVI